MSVRSVSHLQMFFLNPRGHQEWARVSVTYPHTGPYTLTDTYIHTHSHTQESISLSLLIF